MSDPDVNLPELVVPLAFPLLSSWVNTALYTAQVFLALSYLKYYAGGVKIYKFGTCIALLLDGCCSVILLVDLYTLVVINHGFEAGPRWTLSAMSILGNVTSAIGQAFFVYRYYTMNGKIWFIAFIALLILAYNSLSFITAYVSLTASDFLISGSDGISMAIANTVLCAAADVLIAGALVVKVTRLDTSLFYSETRGILRRLAFFSVACGLTTTLYAAIKIILLFSNLRAFFFMLFLQGRVYSLTTLGNLIVLKALNAHDGGNIHDVHGGTGCSSEGNEINFRADSHSRGNTSDRTQDPTFAVVLGPFSEDLGSDDEAKPDTGARYATV
ncbi:hypothetical protein CYLTODRAFT_439363 [Cylindrobasidium torrendii FP15055 ss-10]|uniref:DUF6534 domain-containing protein n=1 Tax=Cylindrobasidium torrendii FP15055 ss-10 TaxID=1314674 RepID=A0A0D7BUE1_9AGAR|nr:hypothetical protein CYLTODRAFT_439363 [Cylindrobasidium torrendii FP15055 ss-10]